MVTAKQELEHAKHFTSTIKEQLAKGFTKKMAYGFCWECKVKVSHNSNCKPCYKYKEKEVKE